MRKTKPAFVKAKTKGLIVASFFAIILITSTLSVAMNNNTKRQNQETKITVTGTPADNFPDDQRARFCGDGSDGKSTPYVKEFKIPTACTQPLAITTDNSGTVYFAQTNTGKIAKFDPNTEQFTEFDNPQWPAHGRTMSWGIDYSPGGDLWYTDDSYNSIWKFSIADGKYERISYPTKENSLPQKIKIVGSHAIINDFNEGKLSVFDITQTSQQKTYANIPSPTDTFVGGFDLDSAGNVWYTNWIFRQGGSLVKFDYNKFTNFISSNPDQNYTLRDYATSFNLPTSINAPNGLSVDKSGNVWIADTDSSSFYKFSESDKSFTKYITSEPPLSMYGNATGVIKTPVSHPYWTQIQDNVLYFNEQTSNAIAAYDLEKDSLVEYFVPSKNPEWADCGAMVDCGIAQIFGFDVVGDKVWFTEWAENKIGKVDLSKPLSGMVSVSEKQLTLKKGQSVTVDFHVNTDSETQILSRATSNFSDIAVQIPTKSISSTQTLPVTISASQSALSGTYKVLLTARNADVATSEFVTVTIQ